MQDFSHQQYCFVNPQAMFFVHEIEFDPDNVELNQPRPPASKSEPAGAPTKLLPLGNYLRRIIAHNATVILSAPLRFRSTMLDYVETAQTKGLDISFGWY